MTTPNSGTATTATTTIDHPGVGTVELSVTRRGVGRARPFLVLHGGAGPQSVAPFCDLLARTPDADVLAPTHPGFGGTVRPDRLVGTEALAAVYAALLDELDLGGVTLIGNSVGGWAASELALLAPTRISRLVLLDATGIEVTGHPVADVRSMPLDEILALGFHEPAPFRIDPATLTEQAKAIAAGNGAALGAYSGASGSDPTLRTRLAQLQCPTLVLWGQSDGIVDADYGQAYAAAIPRARFHLLAATGHNPQLETPHHVATAALDFADHGLASGTDPVWSAELVVTTDVTPDAVWAALHDRYTGTLRSERSDRVDLHGPFAVGTELSVSPAGADIVVPCEIVELVEGTLFSYRATLDGLVLTSRHTLDPHADGGTVITHYQEIAGPSAALAGPELGGRITADTPDAMEDLVDAARRRTDH